MRFTSTMAFSVPRPRATEHVVHGGQDRYDIRLHVSRT